MAVRSASYEFKDLTAFLTAYRESISQSSMFIEPGGIDTDVVRPTTLDAEGRVELEAKRASAEEARKGAENAPEAVGVLNSQPGFVGSAVRQAKVRRSAGGAPRAPRTSIAGAKA